MNFEKIYHKNKKCKDKNRKKLDAGSKKNKLEFEKT